MRLKQISTDWIQYVTEKGQLFYYNDADGSFQWENPLLQHEHDPSPTGKTTKGGMISGTTSIGITTASSTIGSRPSMHDKDYVDLSSSMWKAYLDPDSGSIFWYNEETHVSQWEMPQEIEDQHNLKSTATSIESGSDRQDDQHGHHLDLQLATGSNEKYSITTFNQSNTTRSGSGQRVGNVAHYRYDELDDNEGVVVTVDDHEHDLGI